MKLCAFRKRIRDHSSGSNRMWRKGKRYGIEGTGGGGPEAALGRPQGSALVGRLRSTQPAVLRRRHGRRRSLRIEPLEQRALLDAAALFDHVVYDPIQVGGSGVIPASTSPPSSALVPYQIQTAYGIGAISLGGVAGTGSGQTIAIVDAYNDPNIVSDAAAFDATAQISLQPFNVSGGPTLTVLSEHGQPVSTSRHNPNYVPTDPNGPASSTGKSTWEEEESLDVEWAHAVAPQANVILFEAASDSWSDIMTAVQTAAGYSGLSVVSMSWGAPESDISGESSYDSYFTHQGVTFVASTGDSGAPGEYPAYSPNVVAVGGTSLKLNSDNTYKSESAWSGSGGGKSTQEGEPIWQQSVQTSGVRETPDVAFDADPNTGVAIYDSYDYSGSPWLQIGGTSLAAPCWAGLIAIADQLRAAQSLGTLGGASQTLPTLYSIGAADFHDVTSGSNGYSAGPGYDLVTGLGTPVANKLVLDLAAPAATRTTVGAAPSSSVYGQSVTLTATVAAAPGYATPTGGTVTFSSGGTTLGSAALVSGTATLATTLLPAGSDPLSTSYNGGGSGFAGSVTSGAVSASVSPAPLTVTPAAQTKTYGGTFTAFTGTITGIQNGDNLSATYSSSGAAATAGVSGSPYTITAAIDDPGGQLGNYTVILNQNWLTVSPAQLTVTADNQSRVYGAADPPLTAGISGFVDGESLGTSGVSGTPALTADNTSASPVGSYTITAAQGSLAAQNYTFNFAAGTLTVTPATITVDSDQTTASLPALGASNDFQAVTVEPGAQLTVDSPVDIESGGSASVLSGGELTVPGLDLGSAPPRSTSTAARCRPATPSKPPSP